ncbi:MAG: asparagine synthase (glutamine-hydrolyzing) [Acetobacterales bacterium]
MCGIGAIFAYGPDAPAVEPRALDALGDAMAARGPDAEGTWRSANGRAGLAHRRLSIIDLSDAAAQPMVAAGGDELAIAYNGEIYNYPALRAELETGGVRFASDSDTEVLLHLYRRDGTGMFCLLRGMYAFALWDGARGGMLLARDPLGIKPLYLADDGGTVRAASQVRALLAAARADIDTAPDAAGQAGFWLWGSVPEPHTLYRGIRALPAGHWQWIDGRGAAPAAAHFDLAGVLSAASTAPQAALDLRAALLDSVRHHLVADVPVGVFLSAGRDSATIAALATECLAEARAPTLRTLTLRFEEFAGTAADESPLAGEVAAAYGTAHRTETVRAADFAAGRDALLASMDQPSIDGVNVWFVARAARAAGLKVAMSGIGGDELFGGYDSFRQVPRLARLMRPLAAIPGVGRGFRLVTAPLLRSLSSRIPAKTAGLIELGGTPHGAYLLRRGLFMPWELPRLMDPEMARVGWETLAPLSALADVTAATDSDRLRVTGFETAQYLRNQLLRDADWAGMAHGVEIRTPLVDATLLQAVLPALAGPAPPGKSDLAAAARPSLPASLLGRPKTGFAIPVRDWLMGERENGTERGLRGWAREVMAAFA